MLAAHSGDPQRAEDAPDYDRTARDRAAAVAVGFLLLAALLSVAFGPLSPTIHGADDRTLTESVLTRRPQQRLLQSVSDESGRARLAAATSAPRLTNTERVGLDLFRSHPLGLELAGVILLVSLLGAVVIARKRIMETDEDLTHIHI